MATTTLAPSAAERHVGTGGVNIFGRQQSLRADFLALVALLVQLRTETWVPANVASAGDAASVDQRGLGIQFGGASWSAAR